MTIGSWSRRPSTSWGSEGDEGAREEGTGKTEGAVDANASYVNYTGWTQGQRAGTGRGGAGRGHSEAGRGRGGETVRRARRGTGRVKM
jgi:hypothetical protein